MRTPPSSVPKKQAHIIQSSPAYPKDKAETSRRTPIPAHVFKNERTDCFQIIPEYKALVVNNRTTSSFSQSGDKSALHEIKAYSIRRRTITAIGFEKCLCKPKCDKSKSKGVGFRERFHLKNEAQINDYRSSFTKDEGKLAFHEIAPSVFGKKSIATFQIKNKIQASENGKDSYPPENKIEPLPHNTEDGTVRRGTITTSNKGRCLDKDRYKGNETYSIGSRGTIEKHRTTGDSLKSDDHEEGKITLPFEDRIDLERSSLKNLHGLSKAQSLESQYHEETTGVIEPNDTQFGNKDENNDPEVLRRQSSSTNIEENRVISNLIKNDIKAYDSTPQKFNDLSNIQGVKRETRINKRRTEVPGPSRTWSLFLMFLGLLLATSWPSKAEALAGGQKYSTRAVKTRYGSLRGIIARATAVETYLGVPYATPPLGALRYMPPVTPTPWRGTKFADTMPPACPQRAPSLDATQPRSRRVYIEKVTRLLANQSEDCLYLNLYVPRLPHGSTTDLLPALLLVHGDSYSWGAGNPLDGTALAAHGRLIVVSINFRLGVLGFLKTGSKGSAQGNYGLMDLVAGLHWLRENLGAFGGDPERLALLGHGTGAALANLLAVSPMAKELVQRVVLLGGSALSSWAIQRDPLTVKRRVAEQTGCPGDVEADDIAPCLRLRSLDDLLDVKLDPPRFTSGFAPFIDGAVLPPSNTQIFQPTVSSSGLIPVVPGPGAEYASFGERDLLMGLTSGEAWLDLTDEDLQNGLNETRRDRILRTFVRNTYRYHLHEIYSTLRNEYTDWERGEQSPSMICEGLLSLLGDGQVAAPLLRLALLHSASGGRGYFLHFQPGERPSLKGEELPYLLGIPLLHGEATAAAPATQSNYSAADESLSRLVVHYLANFVRRGDPNGANSLNSAEALAYSPPFWDSYDSINQLYLEAGRTTEMRSHYRGHKMSLWLNLLPQLHRPGYEITMRHHHLSESPTLYEGAVRPQSMALPIPPPPLPNPSPTQPSMSANLVPTTECTPNMTTSLPTIPRTQHPNLGPGPNNLLRKLASSHYQSYTTALTVTIAVGILLLLLNILIFAGIYHRRDRNSSSSAFGDEKKEELLEAGCSGMETSSGKQRLSLSLADSPPSSPPPHKAKLVQELELQLQEFQCSPPPGGGKRVTEPPSYSRSPCSTRTQTPSCVAEDDEVPEPPPPPKAPAPNVNINCPGILRQPGTPGSAKKRVQIQEISV